MPTEDRIRQVATTKEIHGEDHYKTIGARGGKNSPTKFDSSSASAAANKRWAAYRAAKTNEQKGQHGQTES